MKTNCFLVCLLCSVAVVGGCGLAGESDNASNTAFQAQLNHCPFVPDAPSAEGHIITWESPSVKPQVCGAYFKNDSLCDVSKGQSAPPTFNSGSYLCRPCLNGGTKDCDQALGRVYHRIYTFALFYHRLFYNGTAKPVGSWSNQDYANAGLHAAEVLRTASIGDVPSDLAASPLVTDVQGQLCTQYPAIGTSSGGFCSNGENINALLDKLKTDQPDLVFSNFIAADLRLKDSSQYIKQFITNFDVASYNALSSCDKTMVCAESLDALRRANLDSVYFTELFRDLSTTWKPNKLTFSELEMSSRYNVIFTQGGFYTPNSDPLDRQPYLNDAIYKAWEIANRHDWFPKTNGIQNVKDWVSEILHIMYSSSRDFWGAYNGNLDADSQSTVYQTQMMNDAVEALIATNPSLSVSEQDRLRNNFRNSWSELTGQFPALAGLAASSRTGEELCKQVPAAYVFNPNVQFESWVVDMGNISVITQFSDMGQIADSRPNADRAAADHVCLNLATFLTGRHR